MRSPQKYNKYRQCVNKTYESYKSYLSMARILIERIVLAEVCSVLPKYQCLMGNTNAASRSDSPLQKIPRAKNQTSTLPVGTGLAHGFVEGNGNAVGKIQAAVEFSGHGDDAETVSIPFIKLRGKTGGVPAEDQIIAGGVFHIIITCIPVGGKKVQHGIGICFQKLFPVRVTAKVKMFPVIHSCTAQMLFIKRESQRIDQMQDAAGGNGKSADGSGILGDFRGDKNDIKRDHFFLSSNAANIRSQL